MAVTEAKRASINPADAAKQGCACAEQLNVPYVFLSNGREICFWDYAQEAHPRGKTFLSQLDLERRFATNALKRDPLSVAIDTISSRHPAQPNRRKYVFIAQSPL